MSALRDSIGTRFRRIITSSEDGVPPWLVNVQSGEPEGLFTPNDEPWIVHANLTTLIGGIRALLMQALHPGSLAGVADHSRYEADPLGRLAGTTRWLTILTFGSHSAIAKESARVNGMHSRVIGNYVASDGEQKPYRAQDEDLLLWVHIAFTDSFLSTFQLYSGKHISADEYVRKWSKAVAPLGLTNAPQSAAELNATIEEFRTREILDVNETTRKVVDFIKHPPLSRTARIAYWFLFQAALSSIPKQYREMLGLTAIPSKIVQPLATGFVALMRFAIGKRSPLEEAALKRMGLPITNSH
jgi:uncharacterized protein (DUF2236 family)